MYNLLIAIGFAVGILYVIIYAKNFEIKKLKAVIFLTLVYILTYILIFLLYYIVVGNFGGQNMVRVYIFLPFVISFFSLVLDVNVKKGLDFIAPAPMLIFALSHLGCIWGGCCQSNIAVPWGIYNAFSEITLFPNQILESVLAGLTGVYLIYMLKKSNYDMGGKAMGHMLILYGIQRFILEFIRDNYKVFWNISELALWSVAAIIVGVVLNYVLLNPAIMTKIKNKLKLSKNV